VILVQLDTWVVLQDSVVVINALQGRSILRLVHLIVLFVRRGNIPLFPANCLAPLVGMVHTTRSLESALAPNVLLTLTVM